MSGTPETPEPLEPREREDSRQRWEYKIVRGLYDQDELNKLGEEGWELAGVVVSGEITGGHGNIGPMGGTIYGSMGRIDSDLVFKRPKL